VKALIIGASGFVGRHLTTHLERCGDEVVGLDRETDVTDLDAVTRALVQSRPDAIYHLAALSHVGDSWRNPEAYTRVNVVGTQHVLDAARVVVPEATIVLVSSADVYGALEEVDLPVREDHVVSPLSPYAASKVEAERLGLAAARRGQAVMVTRPFNHLGPGQGANFMVPSFLARLRAAASSGDREIVVGDLNARRDFLDVRDVVRAYRLVVEDGVAGEIYNIASGRDISVQDVATALAQRVAPGVGFRVDPALLRPVEVPVLRGDASKLTLATGWTPRYSLDDTLDAIIDADS